MGHPALAVLIAILSWWASTGAIIALIAQPPRRHVAVFAGASVAAALSLYGLAHSARFVTPLASYTSFFCALTAWGWIECSFLTGFVTGPRRAPCPASAKGWTRLRFAVAALLWHELTIVALTVAVVVLTWKAPNQTGTLAFLILAVMRLSAKLNIFLGVPHLSDEALPPQLAYLKSYFRKAKFNLLLPVSLLGSALLGIALAERAISAEAGAMEGFLLLLTLVGLAALEHLFMILPIKDGALWRWATPNTLPPINAPGDGRREAHDGF